METNQNPVQEHPAQVIAPETAQPKPQPVPTSEQPSEQLTPQPQSAKLLYNPEETAQIVKHLTNGIFNPEYILLFGSLAGGTPHSEAMTYDLIIVVRETPAYNWLQAKRDLRYMMPYRQREVSYINLYVCSLSYIQSHNTPFLYYAHKEGVLIYCKDHFHFRRPKRLCDFAGAYCDAKLYYDTFLSLGLQFMQQAKDAMTGKPNVRLAAFSSAQAAIYFYKTLYYVYHGEDFDMYDFVVMHERMRTLSTKLMLLLDDNHINHIFTVPCLKRFLESARYDLKFEIHPFELKMHMERVESMGKIVQSYCNSRLELYKSQCES